MKDRDVSIAEELSLPGRALGEHRQPRTHRSWTPLGRALTATGDHWTLMIVLQLAPGGMRLRELHRHLPGVSTGVLERYVQQMDGLGLLTRRRYREMPPRVELELTSAGRELLPVAGALARWGMRNNWSTPHERERVSVASLLRLLPVLLEERSDLPDGQVTMLVTGEDQRDRLLFAVGEGRLRLGIDRGQDPDASVVGDRRAWIDALGPDADYSRLEFEGDGATARVILDALPGRPPS